MSNRKRVTKEKDGIWVRESEREKDRDEVRVRKKEREWNKEEGKNERKREMKINWREKMREIDYNT
jgi:hypothetical protein